MAQRILLCMCGPIVISGERCNFSTSLSLPSVQLGVRAQGHFINGPGPPIRSARGFGLHGIRPKQDLTLTDVKGGGR